MVNPTFKARVRRRTELPRLARFPVFHTMCHVLLSDGKRRKDLWHS